MKIYTAHHNANRPSKIQVNIPNYSTFKLGLDVEKNGEKIELDRSDIVLRDGEIYINCDGTYNGYCTFPLTTGCACDDKRYSVIVNKEAETIEYTDTIQARFTAPFAETLTFENSAGTLIGKTVKASEIVETITFEDVDGILTNNPGLQGFEFKKDGAQIAVLNRQNDVWFWYIGGERYEEFTVPEGATVKIQCMANPKTAGGFPKEGDIECSFEIKEGEDITMSFDVFVNSVKSSVCDMSEGDQSLSAVAPLKIQGDAISLTADYADKSDLNAAVEDIQTVSGDVETVKTYIPQQAAADNQLADKSFVNSSIGTNTAYFKGTFNSVAELEAVEDPTNNDYGFVISADAAANTLYCRYKYNGTNWLYEYSLNNSSFTSNQWQSINSGITSSLVAELTAVPNTYATKTELANKVQTVTETEWAAISAVAVEGNIYFVIPDAD